MMFYENSQPRYNAGNRVTKVQTFEFLNRIGENVAVNIRNVIL